MSRKKMFKDYRQMYLEAVGEQMKLASYARQKGGEELDKEEVAKYSVCYKAIYDFYWTLFEMIVGGIRENMLNLTDMPDTITEQHAPCIAALLAIPPKQYEDFFDVFVLTPKAFQDMCFGDEFSGPFDGLNSVIDDLNELSKQRLKVLNPDEYDLRMDIVSNPPIWLNTKRFFIPVPIHMECCPLCCPYADDDE